MHSYQLNDLRARVRHLRMAKFWVQAYSLICPTRSREAIQDLFQWLDEQERVAQSMVRSAVGGQKR